MEHKPMTKDEIEKFATDATSDSEQELWEKKELGKDVQYVTKSKTYKGPSKLISLRVPEEVLETLKDIADTEGLRYQTYIISLLKKHIKTKKAG